MHRPPPDISGKSPCIRDFSTEPRREANDPPMLPDFNIAMQLMKIDQQAFKALAKGEAI
jgi:hypothetical protein